MFRLAISKDKVSDDTTIELNIEPKTEWNLYKPPMHASTVNPPLQKGNPLMDLFIDYPVANPPKNIEKYPLESIDERWLSQVIYLYRKKFKKLNRFTGNSQFDYIN